MVAQRIQAMQAMLERIAKKLEIMNQGWYDHNLNYKWSDTLTEQETYQFETVFLQAFQEVTGATPFEQLGWKRMQDFRDSNIKNLNENPYFWGLVWVEATRTALDYLAAYQPASTKRVAQFTILFLAAEPTNAPRLRLEEEFREIQEKLQRAKLRENFELHLRMAVRPSDISQALLDVQPQIVHFSGHGMATGALCFENQAGEIHPIEANALAALFEQFASQIKCVVLNACYSQTQADAISKHIDCVIGTNKAIDNNAAKAFSIGFYQALGAGCPFKIAYNLGCVEIQMQGIKDNSLTIFMKKSA